MQYQNSVKRVMVRKLGTFLIELARGQDSQTDAGLLTKFGQHVTHRRTEAHVALKFKVGISGIEVALGVEHAHEFGGVGNEASGHFACGLNEKVLPAV